ncbi:MAG: hypothetical protein WCH34_15430 [Bacteroidota bacterium]
MAKCHGFSLMMIIANYLVFREELQIPLTINIFRSAGENDTGKA